MERVNITQPYANLKAVEGHLLSGDPRSYVDGYTAALDSWYPWNDGSDVIAQAIEKAGGRRDQVDWHGCPFELVLKRYDPVADKFVWTRDTCRMVRQANDTWKDNPKLAYDTGSTWRPMYWRWPTPWPKECGK